MAAISINTETFHQMTRDSTPVLVDFWAPWCTYCRRIEPAYEKAAEAYGDQVIFTKVNIDTEQLLARQEQIEVIPTLVLYQNGKALGSIVAPESKSMIDTFLRDTLAN